MLLRRSAFLLPAIVGLGFLSMDGCGGSKKANSDDTGGGHGNIGAPCVSDRNCTPSGTVCDKDHNVCVACNANGDCKGAGQICVDSSCVKAPECASSKDCATATVCDSSGHCVECTGDSDCSGGQLCVKNKCRPSCSKNEDCDDSAYCSNGACVRCMCNGQKPDRCLDESIMSCLGNCSAYTLKSNCVGSCQMSGDTPTCPGGTIEVGGSSGAGGSEGKGGSDGKGGSGGAGGTVEKGGAGGESGQNSGGQSVSEAGTGGAVVQDAAPDVAPTCDLDAAPLPGGDPCTKIPKFTGVQKVDGIGDEFCNIPAKTITVATAGYKNPADQTDAVSEATIRVAWSTSALHAHVHVKAAGPLVQDKTNIYDGDNVQFFVAGIKPVTADNNGKSNGGANQILIAPPAGGNPAKNAVAPTGTDAPPTYEAAARVVPDGYEVEVRWNWASTAQIGPDKQIGLDILIGVSNPDAGNRKLEYALQYTQVKTDCGQPYCDAQSWCTPTLAQ